jgi:hypothetical protein
MKQAPAVMHAVKEIMLEHLAELPAQIKAKRADEAEVTLFCSGFQRLFQYFDVVSHYCYQPYGSITDCQVADIKKLGGFMDRLWRKLSKNVPQASH